MAIKGNEYNRLTIELESGVCLKIGDYDKVVFWFETDMCYCGDFETEQTKTFKFQEFAAEIIKAQRMREKYDKTWREIELKVHRKERKKLDNCQAAIINLQEEKIKLQEEIACLKKAFKTISD